MKWVGEPQPKSAFDVFLGWLGAAFIIAAYFLLTIEFVSHKDIFYNLMNFTGGGILAYRVWLDRNYSEMFLEFFFYQRSYICDS